MPLIIFQVAHAMIGETSLPHGPAPLEAKRGASLDELRRPFQRNLLRRCDQQMQVIGHDHEFMQKIFSLVAIMRQRFEQKISRCIATEDRLAVSSNRCDEENAISIHS